MNALEIARKMAAFEQVKDAQRAYMLALQQNDIAPAEEYEAAIYLLQTGGDYRISYTSLQKLYAAGHFQKEALSIMTQAFYMPNVKLQKTRYEKNCKLLRQYPYLFRQDFLPFEELPVQFYPFDDNGFLPFHKKEGRFDAYVNFNHPVVSRNFFHDLENPILAENVFSQYELEYLNDTVRKSEWAARDNHIYLHYPDWGTFCAYLQCLNMRPLLEDKKFVFLIGEEINRYPLDFKAQFGVDYSIYQVKPFSVREVNRLIWHAQLGTHNGGDFFNEIFFGHPNLLALESVMFDTIVEIVSSLRDKITKASTRSLSNLTFNLKSDDDKDEREVQIDKRILDQLFLLRDLSDKDIFVAIFLSNSGINANLDRNARIAPIIFFQPHFHNIVYTMAHSADHRTVLHSEQYDTVRHSPIFQGFKYIKTFNPMRRITTSYAATARFMAAHFDAETGKPLTLGEDGEPVRTKIPDQISQRILNRSFMIDWQDRLFKDSILVRFEDGKLNPKATFTALAAFLDIPYTESMTYCSGLNGLNPVSMQGNVTGFDPATVYRTYDDFANDAERCFLEYFTRDAYAYYGYDMLYYDGTPMDEARIETLISQFAMLDAHMRKSIFWQCQRDISRVEIHTDGKRLETVEEKFPVVDALVTQSMAEYKENRIRIATRLLNGLHFVNKNGQPLRMMPLLQLDPALLEQPLYH